MGVAQGMKVKARCNLGALLKRDNKTQAWLAHAISYGLDNPVSTQLISDWSNGRGTPSHGYTLRILKVTGWRYEELFEEEEG
jgi:hypothetical protein